MGWGSGIILPGPWVEFSKSSHAAAGQLGDGHTSALIQATIIVPPLRLDVCDGRHTPIVMNSVVLGSAAGSARGGF
jgi:hypothetical protein